MITALFFHRPAGDRGLAANVPLLPHGHRAHSDRCGAAARARLAGPAQAECGTARAGPCRLYTCLSATWAANPEGALSKSSLLAAARSSCSPAKRRHHHARRRGSAARLTRLDRRRALRRRLPPLELLTDGALTRFTMNTISVFRPERAKHITSSTGRVTKINLSEFNQHAAMLALLLWPGLLALRSACRDAAPPPPRRSVFRRARGADRDLRARFLASRDRRVARRCSARAGDGPAPPFAGWRRCGASASCWCCRSTSSPTKRSASGAMAAELGPGAGHHLGVHRRARARAAMARHRRRLDAGHQRQGRHAGLAQGLRLSSAPPASTPIISFSRSGTSSGWSA